MGKSEINRSISMNCSAGNNIKNHFIQLFIPIIFILLICSVIYYNSLNAPFVFDDIVCIVRNYDITQLKDIIPKLINYDRPITILSFALNYYFGKLNTFGYHIFNIIIHIINCVLVFFIVKKMVFYVYQKKSVLYPFFVSLIFTVHPINTEVVTYIYNRSASLSSMFYLFSLIFFIKSIEKHKNYFILTVIFFILSYLTKQIGITLPLIILIFDYIYLSDFDIRKVIKKKSYHIVLWIVLVFLLVLQYFYFNETQLQKKDYFWTGLSYYLVQPWVILKFLKLSFIPIGFCIDHQIYPLRTLFEYRSISSLIFVIIMIIVIYKLFIRRTELSKLFLFAILWYFIILVPTSIIKVHIGERHFYLPNIGVYMVIVGLYFLVLRKDLYLVWNTILFILLIVHVTVLGIITVNRNKLYQNPLLLWQDVVKKYPNNALAHDHLGIIYHEKGALDKAYEEYIKSIELDPEKENAYTHLGVWYVDKKMYDESIKYFKEAVRIAPNNVEAINNLAGGYFMKNMFEEAIRNYRCALKINPYYLEARKNLAITYYKTGKYEEALQEYRFIKRNFTDEPVEKNMEELEKLILSKNIRKW